MSLEVVPRRRQTTRALLPLGVLFLAVGFGTAVVLPFLSLFLSMAVRADPLRVAVFLITAPLSGVLVSTLIGRLSDRWPIRRALLIGAAVAGVVSAGLTAFVRDYWILLAVTASATALASSLFPQTFAYARQVLAGADAHRAAVGISTLRTVFSLAWVAGPPVAAVLLSTGDFSLLYGTAAAMYALAALIAIFFLKTINTAEVPVIGPDLPGARSASRPTLLLTAAAFTLLQCPLTLAVQTLPLFISADLGGKGGDAGLILGLCAALEIPLMLGLGALTIRIPVRILILAGAGCGVAYYALAAAAANIWVLAVAQLVDALFIAAISGLGISYMQEMRPGQPGRATALFTNTFPIGAVLAGPLFGLAQHFGYRLAFVIATGLCTAGLCLLLATRPAPPAEVAGLSPRADAAG